MSCRRWYYVKQIDQLDTITVTSKQMTNVSVTKRAYDHRVKLPCSPYSSTNLMNIVTSPCSSCSLTNVMNMMTSTCSLCSHTNSTIIMIIMYGIKIMYSSAKKAFPPYAVICMWRQETTRSN